MIKASNKDCVNSILKLFNHILESGKFPAIWKSTLLVPLHKSGDKCDPNNYRAIALSSCLSKLFTSVLNKRLIKYLEVNNLFSPYQFGFRKNRRTSDCVFLLKTAIDKMFCTKGLKNSSSSKLYVAFVDFRKAFDSVWRKGLFLKMQRLGITGGFYNIVKSMYDNTQYKMKLPTGISDGFLSSCGVKQGCNLSPTLFNIFLK